MCKYKNGKHITNVQVFVQKHIKKDFNTQIKVCKYYNPKTISV